MHCNRTPPYTLLAFILIASIGGAKAYAEAESERWGDSQSHEALPTDRANRIIKWCEDEGDHVRFASANLKIKGYHPCGKLGVMSSCSPDGRRFIGSSKNAPHGYLDCARGPRIYIKRHDDGMIYSSDGSTLEQDYDEEEKPTLPETEEINSDDPVKPLTRAEREQLTKEFERLSKDRNSQLTALKNYLPLIEAFKRAQQKKGSGRSPGGAVPKIRPADLIKDLDPQSKQILRDVLGPNYEKRLRKLFPEERPFSK